MEIGQPPQRKEKSMREGKRRRVVRGRSWRQGGMRLWVKGKVKRRKEEEEDSRRREREHTD
ncbi:hypothetical protein COB52_05450 [Candidatus Kaiserbacteria bacterium]|nr:MAG: hypothetical protein COB52_05450 [Candidatus Kaiserbacteria bacterium]